MSDITTRRLYYLAGFDLRHNAIDSLPERERELANQDDMRAIRDAIFPEAATSPDRQHDVMNIQRKFGLPPISETV